MAKNSKEALEIQEFIESAMSRNDKLQLEELITFKRSFIVLPKDELFKVTQSMNRSPQAVAKEAFLRLLAIRKILKGYEVSFASENSGDLLREVTPKVQDQIGSQGVKHLPYHSDMGYLRFPGEDTHPNKTCAPDYLALTCITNEEKVGTYVVDIAAIEKRLNSRYTELKEPWYSFQSPDSVSPVKKYRGKQIVRADVKHADVDLIRWEKCLPNRLEGAKAYTEIYTTLEDLNIGQEIILEPGQTLIFDNRRCLHGRKAIPSLPKTKEKRLLYRLYINRGTTPPNPVNRQSKHLQDG